MDGDRNLLFGVFAVQLKRVRPAELVEAAAAWAVDPSRDLASRLIEQGALSPSDRDLVDRLVAQAVETHGGDFSATLDTFGGMDQVMESFQGTLVRRAPDQIEPAGGSSPRQVDTEAGTVPAVDETPGRYSQLGEYSHGGMGRILLVHDEHLGREVALKELLPGLREAETAGEPTPARKAARFTARFLQEARITGQLEHPSIVPVYELGRRSDGTLYYTMKLVRGRSLAEALKDAESMEGRLALLPHVAGLCQAIAYAHSRGVIHRDIKPANVMVGEFGETVVIDWGLAKLRGRHDAQADRMAETLRLLNMDEDAAVQTLDGQALGTPAYMPPEQARGDLGNVDERSDVYSLGAVLYATLAGRPPIRGESVKAVMDAAVKGQWEPLDATAPGAPAELVAICRRAMDAQPSARYQSAKELADDLSRYLSGALVRAHRYKLSEQLRWYLRRHKGAVATAAIAALLLLATGAYFNVRLYQSRNRERSLRQTAEENWTEAERQRERAVQQKELALDAIQTLTYEFPRKMEDIPRTLAVQRELLERGVTLLDDVLALEPDTPEAWRAKAANFDRMGDRWLRLGDTAAARDAYENALAIRQRMFGTAQEGTAGALELSFSYEKLGGLALELGHHDEAVRYHEDAMAACLAHGRTHPDDVHAQWDVSICHEKLGDAYLSAGGLEKALEQYRACLLLRQQYRDRAPESLDVPRAIAVAHEKRGGALLRLGRPEEALDAQREALALRRARFEEDPRGLESRRDLSVSLEKTGDALLALGRGEEALEPLAEMLALRRDDAEAGPEDVQAQRDLSVALERIGSAYRLAKRFEQAAAAFGESLSIRRALARKDPGNARAARDLSVAFYKLQDILVQRANWQAWRDLSGSHIALARELAAAAPDNAGAKETLATALNVTAWYLLTEEPLAKESGERALALAKELNDLTGHADPHHLDTLALAYAEAGAVDQAVAVQQEAIEKLTAAGGADVLVREFEERLEQYNAGARP